MLSSESRPYDDAVLVIKMIMILSHGNSNIERGFSINKDCYETKQLKGLLLDPATACLSEFTTTSDLKILPNSYL